jgi:hypothetical protein
MHTPKYDPHNYDPKQCYSAKRLSRYDMQVAGIVVYVVAMTVFFAIAVTVMLFGTGTVTEAHAISDNRGLKNKLTESTQPLPTPQVHPERVSAN